MGVGGGFMDLCLLQRVSDRKQRPGDSDAVVRQWLCVCVFVVTCYLSGMETRPLNNLQLKCGLLT